MCFAIPGKVVEIKDDLVFVDYDSEKRVVNVKLVDVSVGDWVIVKNKIVLRKVPKEEVNKIFEVLKYD